MGNAAKPASHGNPPRRREDSDRPSTAVDEGVKRLHDTMIKELNDHLNSSMEAEWEAFTFVLRIYLSKTDLAGVTTMFEVCDRLKTGGKIRCGEYDKLKKLFSSIQNQTCCDIVDKYSRQMEEVNTQHHRTQQDVTPKTGTKVNTRSANNTPAGKGVTPAKQEHNKNSPVKNTPAKKTPAKNTPATKGQTPGFKKQTPKLQKIAQQEEEFDDDDDDIEDENVTPKTGTKVNTRSANNTPAGKGVTPAKQEHNKNSPVKNTPAKKTPAKNTPATKGQTPGVKKQTPKPQKIAQQEEEFDDDDDDIEDENQPSTSTYTGSLNDKTLRFLAKKLRSEWRGIMTNLELPQEEIGISARNYPRDVVECAFNCFVKWRNRNSHRSDVALVQDLISALDREGRRDIIEELAKSFSITGSLNDKTLRFLAKKLPSEWRGIMTNLELPQEEIDISARNYPRDVVECAFNCFVKWRNRNSHRSDVALVQDLISALDREGRRDIIEELAKSFSITASSGTSKKPSGKAFDWLRNEMATKADLQRVVDKMDKSSSGMSKKPSGLDKEKKTLIQIPEGAPIHLTKTLVEKFPKSENASDLKVIIPRIREKLNLIYPGLNPTIVPCRKADIDFTSPIFIAYSEEVVQISSERVIGFNVLIRNPRIVDKEGIKACNYEKDLGHKLTQDELISADKVIKAWSKELWETHSNLSVITVSGVKSRKNGFEKKVCIVLSCISKGYIPINEEPFPKVLKTNNINIDVDIREGYFEFGPAIYDTCHSRSFHQRLKIGCSISAEEGTYGGSLGPFVDLGNGKTGFITCAHVLFEIQNNSLEYCHQPTDPKFVLQPAATTCGSNNNTPCGHVVGALFKPDRDVSIDAAVVEITDANREPQEGLFALPDTVQHQSKGFIDMPKFNNGTCCNETSGTITNRKIIKVGSKTDLTQGFIASYGIEVRSLEAYLCLPNNTNFKVAMKQQIAVDFIESSFFMPGDSGSGVFKMEDDRTLQCIGIAIGTTTSGKTVVTPIKHVLEALDIRHGLKVFPEKMDM